MSDSYSAPVISLLDIADWRQRTFALYGDVRAIAATDPLAAHGVWRSGRDEMFAKHPASPLVPEARSGFKGLPFFNYDAAFRFEVAIEPAASEQRDVTTGTDGMVRFERIGAVRPDIIGRLDVWRLAGYGGGIFVPVKDALAGGNGGTYGGGRYLIDTIKGADLGRGKAPPSLILDFNFAYNPSCAYDPRWLCPLAGQGNIVATAIPVGEKVG